MSERSALSAAALAIAIVAASSSFAQAQSASASRVFWDGEAKVKGSDKPESKLSVALGWDFNGVQRLGGLRLGLSGEVPATLRGSEFTSRIDRMIPSWRVGAVAGYDLVLSSDDALCPPPELIEPFFDAQHQLALAKSKLEGSYAAFSAAVASANPADITTRSQELREALGEYSKAKEKRDSLREQLGDRAEEIEDDPGNAAVVARNCYATSKPEAILFAELAGQWGSREFSWEPLDSKKQRQRRDDVAVSLDLSFFLRGRLNTATGAAGRTIAPALSLRYEEAWKAGDAVPVLGAPSMATVEQEGENRIVKAPSYVPSLACRAFLFFEASPQARWLAFGPSIGVTVAGGSTFEKYTGLNDRLVLRAEWWTYLIPRDAKISTRVGISPLVDWIPRGKKEAERTVEGGVLISLRTSMRIWTY